MKRKTLIKGIAVGVGIVALYTAGAVGYYAAVHHGARDSKGESAEGTFGDAFGGFNAYFTGLAFIGVVATLLLQSRQVQMQSEELRLQRQELADTREELRRSANAQEKTEQALASQVRANAISASISAALARGQDAAIEVMKRYSKFVPSDPQTWHVNYLEGFLETFDAPKWPGNPNEIRDAMIAKAHLRLVYEMKKEVAFLHEELRKMWS